MPNDIPIIRLLGLTPDEIFKRGKISKEDEDNLKNYYDKILNEFFKSKEKNNEISKTEC